MHCYQLSTAENELGVVVAMAAESGSHGVPMVPVSWTEMQCPQTLAKEFRKVARVVPESSVQNAQNQRNVPPSAQPIPSTSTST